MDPIARVSKGASLIGAQPDLVVRDGTESMNSVFHAESVAAVLRNRIEPDSASPRRTSARIEDMETM
jgi:hypothetical protein